MMIERPTVLLTGFGPFPGMPDNATARLVPELAARARAAFPSHEFAYDILPTEWSAAPRRLAALLETHAPSLALHFGVAREATGFRIETVGRNACNLMPDACGAVPLSHTLIEMGPRQRRVAIPVDDVLAALTDLSLPATLSADAGGYLCNAVFYHSLGAGCRAGFIHIPPDLSGPPLTFDDALRGSLAILKTCLEPSFKAPGLS